jgi:GAF domain-containing protein/HAMP domain-containing protein
MVDSATKQVDRHYTSLQTRLAIAFAAMAAIITIAITVMLFLQARRNLYAQFEDRITILLRQAEGKEWPNLLANIKSAPDEGNPSYEFLQQQQEMFMANDPTIGSVYSMRQDQLGVIYYIVGVLSTDLAEKRSPIHFGVFVDSPRQALLDAFKSSSQFSIDKNIHSDETGSWISAYAPIVSTDGKTVGVFGFDISANSLVEAERNMFATSMILMALALPIFAGIGWVIGSRFARPIIQLNEGVNRITSGELNHVVEVKSGDEVEALADSFNKMTGKLNELVNNLEGLVDERTSNLIAKTNELEVASKKMQNRATQLAAVSVVARSVASMRDVNQLLPAITEIISKQFGFYHVGIFLNDALNQYSVLRASNSEGGSKMLAQGHRLRIGQVGIVGNVASSGKPRIALDTGEDAVFFNNPNLPATKSEMALPLKAGEQIIGVLDVQSTESAAFKTEDVEILSILADQISIAIENARLFEEAQKSTADAQSALRQYTRSDWATLQKSRTNPGYRYTYKGVEPLERKPRTEGQLLGSEKSVVRIPITIHDEKIGSLGLALPADKVLSEDEMDIAKAIAERVALSVENARLFEETSSRAERERTVAAISNKIRSTNDPELMIQTALQELQQALGASKVQILPYSTGDKPATHPPAKTRKTRAKLHDKPKNEGETQ